MHLRSSAATKKNRLRGCPHSAGFAIRSPRGMGDLHDIRPRGSQHPSCVSICIPEGGPQGGRKRLIYPQGRRYCRPRQEATRGNNGGNNAAVAGWRWPTRDSRKCLKRQRPALVVAGRCRLRSRRSRVRIAAGALERDREPHATERLLDRRRQCAAAPVGRAREALEAIVARHEHTAVQRIDGQPQS